MDNRTPHFCLLGLLSSVLFTASSTSFGAAISLRNYSDVTITLESTNCLMLGVDQISGLCVNSVSPPNIEWYYPAVSNSLNAGYEEYTNSYEQSTGSQIGYNTYQCEAIFPGFQWKHVNSFVIDAPHPAEPQNIPLEGTLSADIQVSSDLVFDNASMVGYGESGNLLGTGPCSADFSYTGVLKPSPGITGDYLSGSAQTGMSLGSDGEGVIFTVASGDLNSPDIPVSGSFTVTGIGNTGTTTKLSLSSNASGTVTVGTGPYALINLGAGNPAAVSDNGTIASQVLLNGMVYTENSTRAANLRSGFGQTDPTGVFSYFDTPTFIDINDAGQLLASTPASFGGNYSSITRGLLLEPDGTLIDLGDKPLLSNEFPEQNVTTIPYAINNAGTVIGKTNINAFRWSNGVMEWLASDAALYTSSVTAIDVNNLGQIIGNGISFSLFWEPLTATSDFVTTPLDNTVDINEAGMVAGSIIVTGAQHAAIWDGQVVTDLGTLGGLTSSALAINDNGDVVGISDTSTGESHAFLWSGGFMIDLGTLGGANSEPLSLNNSGQVVGWSETGELDTVGNPVKESFLWSGTMKTISSLLPADNPWPVSTLTILDDGSIVGGNKSGGILSSQTLLLKPSSAARAELEVSLSASKNPASSLEPVTVTMTITNNGPDTATGVLPRLSNAGSYFENSHNFITATPQQGSCEINHFNDVFYDYFVKQVSCTPVDIASGASYSVDLIVELYYDEYDPTGTISATATSSVRDDVLSNNSAVIELTAAQGTYDMSVTATATPEPVEVNQPLVYSFVVINNGPDYAGRVSLTNMLPADTEWFSATTTQGTCSGSLSSGGPNCALGGLESGASAQVTLTVIPRVVGLITNNALVSVSTLDPDTTNNEINLISTVSPPSGAQFSTLSTTPSDAVAGAELSYNIGVLNNDSSEITGVTFTDTLPPEVTLVSTTPSQGSCSGTNIVVCDLGAMSANAEVTITLVVSTPTDMDGTLTNTVELVSNESPALIEVMTTAIQTQVDLKATGINPVDPIIGTFSQATFVFENLGPSLAKNVITSEFNTPYQDGVDVVSISQGSCELIEYVETCCGGAILDRWYTNRCTLGDVESGSSVTLVVGSSNDTFAPVTINVSSDTTDIDSTNNTASISIIGRNPESDLGVSATVTPAQLLVGESLTYNYTVVNNGPEKSVRVTLYDTVPDNTEVVSVTLSDGSGTCYSSGVCQLSGLDVGGSATVQIVVIPQIAGVITQTTNISSNVTDPEPANNSVTTSVTVNAPQADLLVTATATPNQLFLGETLTYVYTMVNNGPSAATGTVLGDIVPLGTLLVSATPSVGSCSLTECSIGAMINGQTETVTVIVTPQVVGDLVHNVTLSSDTIDPDLSNNDSVTSVTVNSAVDLVVTMVDSPDPVKKGAKLTYTITVINDGVMSATGVSVVDILPSDIVFEKVTTSSGSCSITGEAGKGNKNTLVTGVNCDLGVLDAGTSAVVSIVIKSRVTGERVNSVTVSSAEIDSDSSNNAVSVTTIVTR